MQRDVDGTGGLPDIRGSLQREPRTPRIGTRDDRDEGLGVRMLRMGDDLLGGPFLDDLAEIHDRDPIGQDPREAQVVRDEEVRQAAFLPEVRHELKDLGPDRHVEHRDRLVRDDEVGLEGQRRRDRDPLALAAAQLVREAEDELARRSRRVILEGPRHERRDLLRVVSDLIHDEGLRDDLVDGLFRVQGLVRILEDQVQASPKGPHLDAEESLRLPSSAEEDLRRSAGRGGGKDHAEQHREGRRSPDRRPDPERIGWRVRQARGPSEGRHDRDEVEREDREERQDCRRPGGRPRRRQRGDDSDEQTGQQARPEDEATIHEGSRDHGRGKDREAHPEDERRGDRSEPNEDLPGVPGELFLPRERVLSSEGIDLGGGVRSTGRAQRLVLSILVRRDLEEDVAFGRVHKAEERFAGRRLATAALADEAEDLPPFDIERDAVHRPDPQGGATGQLPEEAAPEMEPHLQIADPNQRASTVIARGVTSGTPGYRKHAARRPGVTSARAGSAVVQRSNANLHRGWKTQPAGGLMRLGTSPGIEDGIVRCPRMSGKAATSPWAYGCFGSVKTSTVLPTSIIVPAYMIATLSHVSAITLRSWEIRIIDRCSSRRSRSSKSRICAWIITSRAVTGWSAITSFGLQARAMAIITRCRMPPENSWGKSRTRARGMPTSSRSSSARRIATGSSTFSWRTIGSAICRPIRRTGFREFIAPWKMMEMSFHRTFRTAVSEARVRSRPLKRIRPRTIFPLYGRRRMRASAVVVLRQPLSPARRSASPSSKSNETPSTAWTLPSCVVYSTTRSSTSRSGILPPPETRIQDFIERVSEEVEPEHEEDDAQAPDAQPARVPDGDRGVGDRLVDDLPPAHRIGRRETQECEDALRQDRDRHGQDRVREDERERIREDVPEEDPPARDPDHPGPLDEHTLLDAEHLAADHPGRHGPTREADDEDEPREVDHPQLRGDDDHEHEPGDRQHDVVEAHHDLVEPASGETGDEADRGPDDAGHDRGRDSHDEGNPRSPDDLGVDVETEVVRPDRMQGIGPLQERRRIGVRDGLPRTVRREPRCGERQEGEEDEDAHPDHRGAAVVALGPQIAEPSASHGERSTQAAHPRA